MAGGKRVFDDSYTPNKQVAGEQEFDYSTKVYGRVEHELHPFLASSEVRNSIVYASLITLLIAGHESTATERSLAM